jgi:general secretion pathway protein K
MKRARQGERGVALLLVLWIFMILGVIALDFAQYMRDDAMASVNFSEETRGYYIALAGMNRALYDAQRTREQQNRPKKVANGDADDLDDDVPVLVPCDGEWHDGDFSGGKWRVRMTDEGGRIAINRATEPLLTRIVGFMLQGGQPMAGQDRRAANEVATVVDSILDWIDTDDLQRMHGAESEYYEKRRIPYEPKNGFIDAPEELLKIRGITPELFYGTPGVPGLRDVFSVYSRSRTVTVRTVTAPVLQVILGIEADDAADLIRQRDEEGAALLPIVQAQLTGLDPGLAQLLVDQAPRVVTVDASGDAAHERNQSRVTMVADLASDVSEGMRVLRWLDRSPWAGPPIGPTPAAGDDA